jgi:hypothetical protein
VCGSETVNALGMVIVWLQAPVAAYPDTTGIRPTPAGKAENNLSVNGMQVYLGTFCSRLATLRQEWPNGSGCVTFDTFQEAQLVWDATILALTLPVRSGSVLPAVVPFYKLAQFQQPTHATYPTRRATSGGGNSSAPISCSGRHTLLRRPSPHSILNLRQSSACACTHDATLLADWGLVCRAPCSDLEQH